ncbi:peptidylprolyl isomerase [Candidatus Woesearchaeota archaeon]|nr:peptidylprolyl isomerase [Candidatus Woesearchaeota archaeon]
MAVKKGDKVKVDYTGSLDDGTVFDKSEEPLEFEAGSGQIIPGFDQAVMGMNVGDEKTIHVEAKDAYGDHRPELTRKVPRSELPQGEPKEGMMLVLKAPDGNQFPARIAQVTATDITIDLNHPLAGKALNFKIKLVEAA